MPQTPHSVRLERKIEKKVLYYHDLFIETVEAVKTNDLLFQFVFGSNCPDCLSPWVDRDV